jgi:hypothetical protein
VDDFSIVLLNIINLLIRKSAAVGWLAATLSVEMCLVKHQFVIVSRFNDRFELCYVRFCGRERLHTPESRRTGKTLTVD